MLDIDIWNFIWAIVNIAILFVVLRIFLFKPINKIMDERTKSIQNDIDSAQKSREEAEELKTEYTQTLADAKAEAQQIIVKAREEASAAKQEMISSSEEEARQIIDTANKTIENERKRAMQEAQSHVADLAIAAASKIIGENVDDEKNRRLVDDFLAEEGALNNEGE
ncbi:MAG: F0F1 ATP synthase subunit B [Ruminococcus sp.]|nr:F0F1 ATP synthase subunit B [Ruminococcus sp.]MCD7811131.1 F0F1 ATP synthase subunit B [Ruminococcus sp.]